MVPEQAWAYLDVANRSSTHFICETGFYRGMSAHLWLFANPRAVLHTFEDRSPKKIPTSVKVLQGIFPYRLDYHRGETRYTLTVFEPDEPCDVVSIDAGKDGWDPYDDLVDMLPSMKCNATVFFNNTFDDRTVDKPIDNDPSSAAFYNYCTRSYWRAVREGLLKHTSCHQQYLGIRRLRRGNLPKGFCMGRAAAPSICSSKRRSHELSHERRRDAPPH